MKKNILNFLLWIRAGINAAGFIQSLVVSGGTALMWSVTLVLFQRFQQADWYVQGPFIFGVFALCWFITWLYSPLVVRWRLKKMGVMHTRAILPPFEDELPESDRVWAMWHNGGTAFREKIFERLRKPHRLVLLDPESPFLEFHAALYGDEIDSLKTSIRDTQRAAEKEEIEVKTWPGPLPFTMTIFDPESMNGRIRIEFPIPGGPQTRRPSFTVFRRTDPNVYSDLLNFFGQAIGDHKQN